MPTNSNTQPKSENVTIEDSNPFVARTTELWQNANDKMKKLLETRKDLSSSVLDEITPPGNRLSYKSFSSANQLDNNNNNNNKNYSNAAIDSLNSNNNNNNSYNYNDMYDHTPINGNRTESFTSIPQMIRPPQNRPPSSTPSFKTVTIPSDNNSAAVTKKKSNTNLETFYDMNFLHTSNDLLYNESWPYNYPTGTANNSYKPTSTPPNSIDDHVSMLGDSFSKLSTVSNRAMNESNFYANWCVKENASTLPMTSVSSKLPHPSFANPVTTTSSSRPLPYIADNDNINMEIASKFQRVGRSSINTNDLQHYPQSNDFYHLRPIYDFHHRIDNSNTNTSTGCVLSNNNKPYVSWMGKFPVKSHPDPIYSNKVFLGGLPWDITEQGLYVVFKQFGPCTFEWPGKDNRSTRHPPKGYVYLIFENERSVKTLLQYCHHDEHRTQFYFKLKTHATNNEKSIQIIPWNLANSSYLKCSSERLDITKTVFVGGLHGKITAENLAVVFEELFGHVIYAGIDTDKNKYPIGSGRVTFDNFESYRSAIQASFVQINGKNFCKKVQIDPYLEDSICQLCTQKNGPFFCKDFDCLQYFCKDCWIVKHCNPDKPHMINHRPINRQNSSDIFEILNSIQYYSQISIDNLTTVTAANGNHPLSAVKSNNNCAQTFSAVNNNNTNANNNFCVIDAKQSAYEVKTESSCKPSDSNTAS